MLLEKADLLLWLGGFEPIVVVFAGGDIAARRLFQREVKRAPALGKLGFRLKNGADDGGIFFLPRADYGYGAVGRRVVVNDNFERELGLLGKKSADRGLDVALMVVSHAEDADERRGRGRLFPRAENFIFGGIGRFLRDDVPLSAEAFTGEGFCSGVFAQTVEAGRCMGGDWTWRADAHFRPHPLKSIGRSRPIARFAGCDGCIEDPVKLGLRLHPPMIERPGGGGRFGSCCRGVTHERSLSKSDTRS